MDKTPLKSNPWGMEVQSESMVARYTIAAGSHYFDWDDAGADTARMLAGKFIERFKVLTQCGRGWDYPYGGWYERLLGYAESGWIPYVFAEYQSASFEQLYLQDVRPAEWRNADEVSPLLPLPPSGELQQDYVR
jgi:hypothetical protein